MRVVGVEGDVIITHQVHYCRQGHLIAPAGNQEIGLKVFRGPLFKKRVLRATYVIRIPAKFELVGGNRREA